MDSISSCGSAASLCVVPGVLRYFEDAADMASKDICYVDGASARSGAGMVAGRNL